MITDVQVEAAALAIVHEMFAPHELPLDAELMAKYRATARAALQAAEAAAWQPIETAPKDGTSVLVTWVHSVWVNAESTHFMPPTLWRPLPEPPALPLPQP
jgi:hypothetical protein